MSRSIDLRLLGLLYISCLTVSTRAPGANWTMAASAQQGMFFGGAWTSSASGETFEDSSPATGELIAIFDADFIPPRDFLMRTVHYFADPNVEFNIEIDVATFEEEKTGASPPSWTPPAPTMTAPI